MHHHPVAISIIPKSKANWFLFASFLIFSILLSHNAIRAEETTATPPSLADTLPEKLTGHGGPITAITVFDNGNRALTASFDYSAILWDLTKPNGDIIHRLKGHEAAVIDIAIIGNTDKAVSVGDDGALLIWNLKTGEMKTRLKGNRIKNADVAISNDGKRAAVARWDGTVGLFDLELELELFSLQWHRGNVNAVVFSADDRFLYSTGQDGSIAVWNVATGTMVRSLYSHGWGINALDISESGNLLFGAVDGEVALLDVKTGENLFKVTKQDSPIQSVRFSQDGALGGWADGAGHIGVFDPGSGTKIEEGQSTFGPVWDFDFVPNSNQIYHVGLDDFASRWQISPTKLDQNRSKFPRRFQVRETASAGEKEFYRKCSVCHTLTKDGGNRAGPTLYKIFGRKAGELDNYDYSKALKNSPIIWNAETIGRLFDDGPDVVVPGTKMPIQRLKKVERRNDLIEFLKTATQPEDNQ